MGLGIQSQVMFLNRLCQRNHDEPAVFLAEILHAMDAALTNSGFVEFEILPGTVVPVVTFLHAVADDLLPLGGILK